MDDTPSTAADGGTQATEAAPDFYIPAVASWLDLAPQTLKNGDTFAVFDDHGDCVSHDFSPEGLFHRDTRYLSHLRLLVNGYRPLLLSASVQDDNAVLVSDLTNPDLYAAGRLALARDTIHISRAKFLWQASCYERLSIRNFDDKPHTVTLAIEFGADFADLFEVRGARRERRGAEQEPVVSADQVCLGYVGLDGIRRTTTVQFDPSPDQIGAGGATFRLRLEPGQRGALVMTVSCGGEAPPDGNRSQRFLVDLRRAHRALRISARRAAVVVTSNALFNEGFNRSIADLYMLMTETRHGPYPYAGIPWFSTAFGRDALITAFQTLWLDPMVARGVLKYLAAYQATAEDPAADAEPGKILHETRGGEMANLKEVPFGLYYGSVDSTPLFVMLAGAYFERTFDLRTITELWPHIEAALAWIDTYGDRDGDGFVEYGRKTEEGLANQGWKDSHDSVFHADGTMARSPIALVEVQGYVYAAKRAAAALARVLGVAHAAETLERQAAALRQKFEEAFWCPELDTYALALDGDKRPCRVRTSNAGHALFSGIVDPLRAQRVAATLMTSESFSGWGVRTVAASESRYNPMSYHNGSVWPHDNALVALGLARYGLKRPALRIFHGLFDVSLTMGLRRLPELFCGFPRRRHKGPTSYPVACSPQAWASATPAALLQACLGLEFDPRGGEIRFNHPVLPDFLDEVRIDGLTLGTGSVDLRLTRHAHDVAVTVVARRGDVRVVTMT